MLNQLHRIFGSRKTVGLYRNDGLAILHNSSGPATERIRKKLIKTFKDHGLQITTKVGIVRTDFLDLTLDLKLGKYSPFRKPNDQPLYINVLSNHPPVIKKQLPIMILKRLSGLSCNREEFDRALPEYTDAMRKSSYREELECS